MHKKYDLADVCTAIVGIAHRAESSNSRALIGLM
jgi:hypothetical protein